jgi:hypothetical protein
MILHPGPNSACGPDDKVIFDALTRVGERLTGYAEVAGNIYRGPVDFHRGGLCPWAFDSRGIISFSNEIWSVMDHVLLSASDGARGVDHSNDIGVGKDKHEMAGTTEADYVALYKFLDQQYDGAYIQPWTHYEHPELGTVEIGGIDPKWVFQNPPPDLLEAETVGNTDFALALANILPRVTVVDAHVTSLGNGSHKVSVHWRNEGFLATHGSARALETKAVRARAIVRLELTTAAGQQQPLELLVGQLAGEVSHLQGRALGHNAFKHVASADGGAGARVSNPNEERMEWVVRGQGMVEVTVDWQRAGKTTTRLRIGPSTRL